MACRSLLPEMFIHPKASEVRVNGTAKQRPDVGKLVSIIHGTSYDTIESLIRLFVSANRVGLPSFSIPCGLLRRLPLDLQLLGRPMEEQEILNLGAALESTESFITFKPQRFSSPHSADSVIKDPKLRIIADGLPMKSAHESV